MFFGGTALFVLSLAYLVYGGVQQGATYWVTVGELEQHTVVTPQSRVRLGETVTPGSISWDTSHRRLRFLITDG